MHWMESHYGLVPLNLVTNISQAEFGMVGPPIMLMMNYSIVFRLHRRKMTGHSMPVTRTWCSQKTTNPMMNGHSGWRTIICLIR